LTVSFNGSDYTTANGLNVDATAGTWTLDVTDTELTDGTYTVNAVVSDVAGNSATASQNVVVDTTIGDGDANTGAAVTIDGISDDTGTSRSDFVTHDTSLVLNGGVELADGDSLTVSFNGTDYTTANGLNVDATAGTWALDLTATELAEGTYTVSAVVSDVAGNSATASQNVVVDTTIGDGDANTGAAVTIDGITDDTGTSRSDFVTHDTSLVLNGGVELADGDSLTVSFNGSDYTTANGLVITDGTWTLDVTDTELTDGTYTVDAVVSDVAGNSATASQDVVVDTTIGDGDANTGAAVTIDGITDDTGTASDDFITHDTTLMLNGSVELEDGDSLTVSFNGSDYTSADTELQINADGTWTLDVTDTELTDGTYTVNAVVSDVAGNSATASQDVVIDTTAPGEPETGDGNAIAFDDDVLNDSDDLTGVTFTGTLEDDATIDSIVISDGQGGSVTVDGTTITVDGTTISVAGQDLSGLADGELTVTMTVTDQAGNQGSVDDQATLATNDAPIAVDDYQSSGSQTEVFSESFEDHNIRDGGWSIFKGYNGWTMTEGIEIQNGATVTASDGSSHAELDPRNLTQISRQLGTPNDTYTLTFDYQARPGHESDSGMTVTFGEQSVTVATDNNGVVITDAPEGIKPVVTQSVNGWTTISLKVDTSSMEATTLAFEGTGASNSYGAYLDNIRVYAHEPEQVPFDVEEDQSITFSADQLLGNDTDPDGDSLSITGVGDAAQGQVTLNADGTVTFTPNPDYNGLATFSYTVSDGEATDSAIVYVNVKGVDDDGPNDDNKPDPISLIASADGSKGRSYSSGNTLDVSSADNAEVLVDAKGFYSVDGEGNDSANWIEKNDALVLELGQATTSATFEVNGTIGEAQYAIYGEDKIRIGGNNESFDMPTPDESGLITIHHQSDFSYIVFDGGTDSKFAIKPVGLSIQGSESADVLNASAGDDTLTGGKGDDILYGQEGADVFAWQLGDEGSVDDPAEDVVKDFSLAEGDSLDLAELLAGEQAGSIDDYLHAERGADGEDTILHVSTDGGFAGDYAANAGQEDQTITLEGVSMGDQSSEQFINNLINNGNLNID
ncbi:Ig-like domain-containing protein, partial [Onishia taeanensis]